MTNLRDRLQCKRIGDALGACGLSPFSALALTQPRRMPCWPKQMDTLQRAGLALFIAAWFFLAATLFLLARIGIAQQVTTSDFFFVLLIILSGTVFASRYVDRRMRLKRTGRLVMVLIMIGMFLLFFAPAVQTTPTSGGYGSVCIPLPGHEVCSIVTQWASLTAYRFCWGGTYSYDTIDGLQLGIQMGCVPPL